MARDLSFWKEKNSSEKSAADTYKALFDGEELDYVCELPIENILEDVKNTFSDWEQLDAHNYEKDGAAIDVRFEL